MVKHVIIKLKLKDLSASLKSIKGELKRNKEIKLKKNFLQDRSTCPQRMQPPRPTCIATRRETSLLLWRQLNSNILLFKLTFFGLFFMINIQGPITCFTCMLLLGHLYQSWLPFHHHYHQFCKLYFAISHGNPIGNIQLRLCFLFMLQENNFDQTHLSDSVHICLFQSISL